MTLGLSKSEKNEIDRMREKGNKKGSNNRPPSYRSAYWTVIVTVIDNCNCNTCCVMMVTILDVIVGMWQLISSNK